MERALDKLVIGDIEKLQEEVEGSLTYTDRKFGVTLSFSLKGKEIKIDFHNLGYNKFVRSSPSSMRNSSGQWYGPVTRSIHPFEFPGGKIVYLDYNDVGFDRGEVWINGNKLGREDAQHFLAELSENQLYDIREGVEYLEYHSSGYLITKSYTFLGVLIYWVLGDIRLRYKSNRDLYEEREVFKREKEKEKSKEQQQRWKESEHQRILNEEETSKQQALKGSMLLGEILKPKTHK
jgi:hypothetical protein